MFLVSTFSIFYSFNCFCFVASIFDLDLVLHDVESIIPLA